MGNWWSRKSLALKHPKRRQIISISIKPVFLHENTYHISPLVWMLHAALNWGGLISWHPVYWDKWDLASGCIDRSIKLTLPLSLPLSLMYISLSFISLSPFLFLFLSLSLPHLIFLNIFYNTNFGCTILAEIYGRSNDKLLK